MNFVEDDLYRLLVALLVGGLIGVEREYHSKAAGFRTMIMICVGAALFTLASERIGDSGDRIAANIVNGIGFLGAGIVFKEDNRVRGLTTAATVWAVGALGMCIGGGHYDIGLVGAAVVLATLWLMVGTSNWIGSKNQQRDYKIVTTFKNKTLQHYERLFEECGLVPRRGRQERIGNEIIGQWRVSGPDKAHEKCIKRLLNDAEVKQFVF
ncbi:MgtC/SapB family protein [Rudanella lutea]|uniref:MgtC/SapB family protein n=1 Tax=Rudanella lutea TaxID=451374 RepID=UPI00035C5F0A|nr:MgtC/SapB family protein [Rudanella lutea]